MLRATPALQAAADVAALNSAIDGLWAPGSMSADQFIATVQALPEHEQRLLCNRVTDKAADWRATESRGSFMECVPWAMLLVRQDNNIIFKDASKAVVARATKVQLLVCVGACDASKWQSACIALD